MAWKEEKSTTVKIGTSGVLKIYSFDKETNKTSKKERKWKGGSKTLNILKLHIYNLSKVWPRLQNTTSMILSDIILICFIEVVQFHLFHQFLWLKNS